jgi:glycine/D-amino acid oxidase-like deaminating enzyme
VDKTDVSLVLSAFSALAILIGPIAGLVIAAFIAGLLLGQRRRRPP